MLTFDIATCDSFLQKLEEAGSWKWFVHYDDVGCLFIGDGVIGRGLVLIVGSCLEGEAEIEGEGFWHRHSAGL